MFGHRNIVKDTFSISHAGVVEESADSVKVEFNDEDQNYRPTTQLCIFDGGSSDNPRIVKLWGVTNQVQAHQIGMWLLAQSSFRRETITFETGMEGKIPFFGDQIAVSHYLIGQSENETIVNGDVSAFDSVDVLTLTEGVLGLTDPYVVLRNKDGSPTTALQCTILTDTTVRVVDSFDTSLLSFSGSYERTHFTMGSGTTFTALVKVTSVETVGKGRIKISGFVDDPSVYDAADGLSVPALPTQTDPTDLAPVITNLVATVSGTIEDTVVSLNWTGENSDKYDVEYSLDAGTTWTDADKGYTLTTGFEHHLDTPPSAVHYRVAGVSLSRGAWATVIVSIDLDLNDAPDVTGLALETAFTGLTATLIWDDSDAALWQVDVITLGSELIYSVNVTTATVKLLNSILGPLGSGREFDVKVSAINYEGKVNTSGSSTLRIKNEQSATITGVTTQGNIGVIQIEWTPPTEADHSAVAVWVSTTTAFTPGSTTLVTKAAGHGVYAFPADEGVDYYFRLAAYDAWGFDELNYSAEATSSSGAGPSFKSDSGYLYYQVETTALPTVEPTFTLSASSPYNFVTGVLTVATGDWDQVPLVSGETQTNYYYIPFTVSKNGSSDQVIELGTITLGTKFENLVTFTSLTDGSTTIDGGNIKTGSISAARIDTRSLTIKNAAGAILFSESVPIDYAAVAGTKPPTNADNTGSNTAAAISGQGSLATMSSVTETHINIPNLSSLSANIGYITAGTITSVTMSAGSAGVVNSGTNVDSPNATQPGNVPFGYSGKRFVVDNGYVYLDTVQVFRHLYTNAISGQTSSAAPVVNFRNLSSSSLGHGMKSRAAGGHALLAESSGSYAAVYALASGSTNHGLSADSINGDGVHAETTGTGEGVYGLSNAIGGYFRSNGNNYGLYAKASNVGSSSHAMKGFSDGGGAGIVGHANAAYSFYSNTGAVGPFTGAHDGILDPSSLAVIGDILIDKKLVVRKGVNDTIFEEELSSVPNQKNAIGVLSSKPASLVGSEPAALVLSEEEIIIPSSKLNETDKVRTKITMRPKFYSLIDRGKQLIGINSVGEGQINVCGENGNIEAGDLVVTSSIPGKGMKQSDDIVRSKTVAKIRENVTFTSPDEIKMVACIYLCG